MTEESLTIFYTNLYNVGLTFVALTLFLLGILLLAYFIFLWIKYRGREKNSLESVLLQVAVPKDNEVKIDAAEQFFSSLASISHGGFLSFLKSKESISFEIVAKPGDIRFYVSVNHHLRDMVEKQIYGMYPGADIQEKEEYIIFNPKGKVAFSSFVLKGRDYLPLKIYKDLPVDSLSSFTSTLSKMQEGEGAAIQVMITAANDKWKKAGKSYISSVKKI